MNPAPAPCRPIAAPRYPATYRPVTSPLASCHPAIPDRPAIPLPCALPSTNPVTPLPCAKTPRCKCTGAIVHSRRPEKTVPGGRNRIRYFPSSFFTSAATIAPL